MTTCHILTVVVEGLDKYTLKKCVFIQPLYHLDKYTLKKCVFIQSLYHLDKYILKKYVVIIVVSWRILCVDYNGIFKNGEIDFDSLMSREN